MNAICLIECKRCVLHYVGETGQSLHLIMIGYRFDIAHRKIEESSVDVAAHFNIAATLRPIFQCWYVCNLQIMEGRHHPQEKRESKWMRTLGSLWPRGII